MSDYVIPKIYPEREEYVSPDVKYKIEQDFKIWLVRAIENHGEGKPHNMMTPGYIYDYLVSKGIILDSEYLDFEQKARKITSNLKAKSPQVLSDVFTGKISYGGKGYGVLKNTAKRLCLEAKFTKWHQDKMDVKSRL